MDVADPSGVLARYAASLGIPVRDAPDGTPMWNGSALKRPDNAEGWAHEIAHWLLAGARRRWVNYGWGHDFQFVYVEDDHPAELDELPWAPSNECPDDQEEVLASLLGFAFLVRVGEPPPYDTYGFYEYHWDPSLDGPRWRLVPSAYAERRMVQGHVETFSKWLTESVSGVAAGLRVE